MAPSLSSQPVRIARWSGLHGDAAHVPAADCGVALGHLVAPLGDLVFAWCGGPELESSRLGWPGWCGLLLPTPPQDHAPDELPDLDPQLPVVREGELVDPDATEQFLDRVVGYREVHDLFGVDWHLSDLVAFNIRHRFRVIGHDPKRHTLMGRLVAKAKDHPRDRIEREVTTHFLDALARPMTRRKHAHVLRHTAELVGPRIAPPEQAELEEAIAEYERGALSRRVPLRLLRRFAESAHIPGLRAQSYLYPDPLLERFLESGV